MLTADGPRWQSPFRACARTRWALPRPRDAPGTTTASPGPEPAAPAAARGFLAEWARMDAWVGRAHSRAADGSAGGSTAPAGGQAGSAGADRSGT